MKQRGFTIVELLIVIVVIGILAALVITTFAGIQQRARNTERETDVKAIHGQIEVYYTNNGFYPTLANLNDSDFRDTELRGLDDEALQDPNGSTQTIAGSVTANQYSYEVTNASGTACDNTSGNECVEYTLTAVREDDDNYTKSNLN